MNSRVIGSVAAGIVVAMSQGALAQSALNRKAVDEAVNPPSIDLENAQFITGSADESVPRIYLLPMYGQVGTDIHSELYSDLEEDILAHNPDLIVIVMNCRDSLDLMFPRDVGAERSMFDPAEYRHIVDFFHDSNHIGDIPQVIWIEDSLGSSSLIALSWEELYMMPNSRIGGIQRLTAGARAWTDSDVRAKMIAAWTSIGKSFAEYGKYSLNLVDAMLMPDYKLSASFKGRNVDWTLDDAGEYIVDSSEKRTVDFDASSAQDLLISDGTAATLDDLMLLVGYREYRVVESTAWKDIEDYINKWRRVYDQSKDWWLDYQRSMSRAGGEDTVRYLGKAKGSLTQILKARKGYPAVETRWMTDIGLSQLRLEVMIDEIKDRIAMIKQQQRNRGGAGGGGGGLGGGGR